MEWLKHDKMTRFLPDVPDGFELEEFTFFIGYNEYYEKIPVFEIKLSHAEYEVVLRFEDVCSARLDDLESITDIRLDISPIDSGWESIRYYVDNEEGSMSFYCAKWDVLHVRKKQSPERSS
ncbi:hypothetical protein J7E23_12655 [Pseudomonas sp. ISL-88]|uniref:hypothetical protein n=1 Tax=Bacteria TaxID=2 RepID=UPI001BEC6690|nr:MULTISPECIES: hypothetical protein [Bacteria]MBT2634130.1 hypothetical protein [Bacillus sp. ISL-26]MBT2713698.1 hypothetical protein [Pseudomonas sp. ISL-88]